MAYLQIVGLTCWRCDKTISSVTEGRFCPSCCNPIHLTCQLPEGSAVPEGRCRQCGADPQSALALKVRAQVKERMASVRRITCPNCGSTHGFRQFRTDAGSQQIGLLFGVLPFLLLLMIGKGAHMGEVQCCKCEYIFRPRSRGREIGCIIISSLLLVGLIVIMALMIFGS